MSNYNQPTSGDVPEEFYLKQKIEIDAIAFSHKMMLEHFEARTTVPEKIIDLAQKKFVQSKGC